jgi:pyruvate dehydrogenase E2 component (dihydrolipoamide acetyltransferase)
MPVITESGDDGVVTAWFVDEGSSVVADQLIAEVQVEKVAQDVASPGDGFVQHMVNLNEPVAQGASICRLVDAAESSLPSAPHPAAEEALPSVSASRVIASPSAKRVARELEVDLTTVAGSGPGGRITESDVRDSLEESEPGATEMIGLRAVIARNMRRSVHETAPVTLMTTVDVTDTTREYVTGWIVRTVAIVLEDYPELNGIRDGDRFTSAEVAHIAVAIQTADGLIAPVVRGPAALTEMEAAAEIGRLSHLASVQGLSPADHEGGTFTVTNLGGLGIDGFTPIINLPQVAILGVGALRTVPGFDEAGAVVPRRLMTLSLTFDHAFVDGSPAAQFLACVGDRLERET